MVKLKSERELDMVRGKMMVGAATPAELRNFLTYVGVLEGLVEEASNEDVFGSEGWRHRVGWDK